ncbi:MAG: hypothetical protein DRP15_01450 [Candidatus Aenigmatarchaeota archaeon]|nr:MAG: hypothetical protein DRP15_01450 [Candidatus Aenigmarchaeota archaeon]
MVLDFISPEVLKNETENRVDYLRRRTIQMFGDYIEELGINDGKVMNIYQSVLKSLEELGESINRYIDKNMNK